MTSRAACTCPTCGTPYDAEVLRVDLNRNIIITRKGWRKLQPRQAEIMAVLSRHFPEMAEYGDIFIGIYGHGDEPENADHILRVYIARLRGILKPLGWRIVSVWGRGYRLEKSGERDG